MHPALKALPTRKNEHRRDELDPRLSRAACGIITNFPSRVVEGDRSGAVNITVHSHKLQLEDEDECVIIITSPEDTVKRTNFLDYLSASRCAITIHK